MATGRQRVRVDFVGLLLILGLALHVATADHFDNGTQVRCAWAYEVYDLSQNQIPPWVATNGFLGIPDCFPCPRCHSSEGFNISAQIVTLKLRFPKVLFVHRIDIYETLGAGSVVTITATSSNNQNVLWHADGPELVNCSRIFSPILEFLQFPVDIILLKINTTLTSSIEIDGVRIYGRQDIPTELRLVNGPDVSNGVIQVYSVDLMTWGHVCGDHWGLPEANVVCRHLGYAGAEAAIVQRDVAGMFHIQKVNCTGSEMDVTECSFNDSSEGQSCPERMAAGVVCTKDMYGPNCSVPHIANSSSTCTEGLCHKFGDDFLYGESSSTSYSYSHSSFYNSSGSSEYYDSYSSSTNSPNLSSTDNESSSTSSSASSSTSLSSTDNDSSSTSSSTSSTSLSSTDNDSSSTSSSSSSTSLSSTGNDSSSTSSSTSSTSLSSTGNDSSSTSSSSSTSLSSTDNDSSNTSSGTSSTSLSSTGNDSSSTSSSSTGDTSLSTTSFSDSDKFSDSGSLSDSDIGSTSSSNTSSTSLSSTTLSDSDSFTDSTGFSINDSDIGSTSDSSTGSTSPTSLSDSDNGSGSNYGSGNGNGTGSGYVSGSMHGSDSTGENAKKNGQDQISIDSSTAQVTLTSDTATTNFPTEPSSFGFETTLTTLPSSVQNHPASSTNGQPEGCDTFLDRSCSEDESLFYSNLEPRFCGDWLCTIRYQESALSIANGSLDASSLRILHVAQHPIENIPSVYWCALKDENNQWLELNFNRMVGITKLTFVEFEDSPGCMRSFLLSFTVNDGFWQFYVDKDRHPKELDLNADSKFWDDEVNILDPLEALAIRLHPTDWIHQNICTTVTVWGYNITDAHELGMKNNEIFDSQIEVSRSLSGYTATDARFDGPNACCVNTSLGKPVFRVDLLVETTLTGILIQGRDSDQSTASIHPTSDQSTASMHPTSFMVRSSPDSQHWWYRMVSDIDLQNGESFRSDFNKPIFGSKVRLNNFNWADYLCLRFELLGSLHISSLLFADFEDTVPLWREESSHNSSWVWFRIGDIMYNDDITDMFNSSYIFYNWAEGASDCLSNIQPLYPETTPKYSGWGTEGVSTTPPTSLLTMLVTNQTTSPQPTRLNPFYPCMDESSQPPYVSRLLFKEFQDGPCVLVVRLRYLVRGSSSDTKLEVKAVDADDVENTVWKKEAEFEGRAKSGHFVYTIQTGTRIVIQGTIARDDVMAFIALDDVGVYKGLTQPVYRRLGMTGNLFDITSDQLSASTVRPPDPENGDFNVDNARIEIVQGAGAWCPDFTDKNIWFQVDYEGYIELRGIVIQGRASCDEWVTRFRISHSKNGTVWTTEGSAEDGDMIFVGSYDRTTPIYVLLDEPVDTRYVRILPVDWHNQPCLRIELIGFKDGNLPTNEDAISQKSTTPQWSLKDETTPAETTHSGTFTPETTTDHFKPNIKDSRSEVTGSGLITRSNAALFETTSSGSIVNSKTTKTGTTRSGKDKADPGSTPSPNPMVTNLKSTGKSHPHTQMGGAPPPTSEEEAQEKISTASDVEDVYSALMTQEGAVTSKTAKLALQAVSSLTKMKSSSSDGGGQTETVTMTLGAVSSAAGKDKETAEEFLKVCDSLFSDNSTASLQTSDDETDGNSSSSSTSRISAFLYVVDSFAASVTENLLDKNTTEVIISTDNLVLQSWSNLEDRISNDVIELTPNSSQNSFVIPASIVSGKQVKATAIVFKTLHSAISSDVEGQNSNGSTLTGSEVISLTLFRENDSSISVSEESPVELSFQMKQNQSTDYEAKCCFWKYTNDSSGGTWSTDGCRVHESSTESTVCHCDHLTNFAVLLQLRDREIPAAHSMALDILTYVGAILSITALLASIFMFCFLRLLKSQRVIIHVNLAASLATAQLLYLTSIGATSNKGMCKAIAALLHYLFTASFLWMLIEGVHLYTKSVAVFGKGLSTKIYLLVGWGIPLVIVGIALGARFDGYGTESSCWLSLDGGLIYAFVTPVLVVVAVNTLILVMVIRVFITLKANTDKTEKERIRAGIRAVLLLQPLLGFTWIFGLFSSFDDTFFFTYLFVIFNSSQGVFIFLLHCVGDYEVKKAIKKLRGRRTVTSSSTDYSIVQPSRLIRKQTMPTMVAQAAPSTSRPTTSDTHVQQVERNEPHLTAQDLAPLRLKKREISKVSLSSKEAWGLDGMEAKEIVQTKADVYAIQEFDITYGVQEAGASAAGLPEVKTD